MTRRVLEAAWSRTSARRWASGNVVPLRPTAGVLVMAWAPQPCTRGSKPAERLDRTPGPPYLAPLTRIPLISRKARRHEDSQQPPLGQDP
jgi:hypothetical protein